MCGIFGIYNHENAASIAISGGLNLQHRGQETYGVATYNGQGTHVVRGSGKLEKILDKEGYKENLPGNSAIVHLRYATAQIDNNVVKAYTNTNKKITKSELMRDAQPFIFDHLDHNVAYAVNGEIYNAVEKRRQLQEKGVMFRTKSDSEIIYPLAAGSGADDIETQLEITTRIMQGSYSMVMLYDDKMVVMRDHHGIRPLVMGKLDDSYVFASESVALQQIGAKIDREVKPGELITVDKDGFRSRMISAKADRFSCIFELIYFGNPASEYNGSKESLYTIRKRMGNQLWNEHPVDADCVVPILDSGLAASKGYAQASGIPEEIALIKNHYKGRSFIEKDQGIREEIVNTKFIPIRDQIEDKRVVLIDDSIVRSTTMAKLVKTMYSFGAKEVHVRSSSPPIMSPCYDAIDFHSLGELVAANNEVSQIKKMIGASSLGYLSVDGLKKAVNKDIGYCLGCLTGKYPFDVLQNRYKNDLADFKMGNSLG